MQTHSFITFQTNMGKRRGKKKQQSQCLDQGDRVHWMFTHEKRVGSPNFQPFVVRSTPVCVTLTIWSQVSADYSDASVCLGFISCDLLPA